MATSKETLRDRLIVRTSVVGIVTNLCLVAFKLLVGGVGQLHCHHPGRHEQPQRCPVLGDHDSGHQAGRPAPDQKHPFGYGRVEYLTGILIAGIILFAGASFAVTSVQKIFTPDETHYTTVTVVIVAVAIVTKLVLGGLHEEDGEGRPTPAPLTASGADATLTR